MSMEVGVGYSKVEITPPIGVKMAGFASRLKPSEGIHDPLYARTLVIRSQNDILAITSVDLIAIMKEIYDDIVKEIKSRITDRNINLLITATHTHSGPHIGYCGKDWVDLSWLNQMKKKVVSSIIMALSNCKEGLMGYGVNELYGISENRREKGGPIDPYLKVIAFNTPTNEIISTIVKYSMHPVVLRYNNLYISADYPGAVCHYLEKWGYPNPLFLQGCCGDIRPNIVGKLGSVIEVSRSFREIDRLGRIIAASVIKTREMIEDYQEIKEVKARIVEAKLEVQKLPDLQNVERELEEYEKIFGEVTKLEDKIKIHWKIYANRLIKYLLKERVVNGFVQTYIGIVKVNDILMVTLPGEPLVRVLQKIANIIEKKGYKKYLVIGYTNDCISYIPSDYDFEKGSYETTVPWCILTKDSVNKLIDLVKSEIDKF